MVWRHRSPKGRTLAYRHRRFAFCPCCGVDLEKLEPIRLGELYADPMGDTFWKGEPVDLTPTQRLILHSLLTARPSSQGKAGDAGPFISNWLIAERAGITTASLKSYMSLLRLKFRAIDPGFDHIETGKNEHRWSEKLLRSKVIASNSDLTLFERGRVLWRNKFSIYLSEVESIVLCELIKADGRPVATRKLSEACGWSERGARRVPRLIRKKFGAADDIPIIGVKQRHGYFLIPPPTRIAGHMRSS